MRALEVAKSLLAEAGKAEITANEVNGGYQIIFQFENGYGASVVCHSGSYGGLSGLWELAVLDSTGELRFDTEITEDVLGYLSVEDVTEILVRIQGLKPRLELD